MTMILVINTASDREVLIALAKAGKKVYEKKFFAQYQQVEKLLPEIDKMLKKQKTTLADLTGIIVVSGPGPFTSIRIGLTTANILSWFLKIPAVGVKISQFKNITQLITIGERNLKGRGKESVLPFYGKAPNITKRKKVI